MKIPIDELLKYLRSELDGFTDPEELRYFGLYNYQLDSIVALLDLYVKTKCKGQKKIRLIPILHNETEALFKLQAKHLTEKKEKLDVRGIYQTLSFICPVCNESISKDINSPEDIVCSCGYRILSIPKMKNRFTEFKIMEKEE